MKFTEALQKAYENPGMEFERKSKVCNKISMVYKSNGITFRAGNEQTTDPQNYINSADFEADWQPVPKEVTWQEAIQANLEGKTIKHVYDENKEYVTMTNSERIFYSPPASYPVSRIKNGKWYILEG